MSRAPAHPPRRRRRSIWPISDPAHGSGSCTPDTHPLSPRPRESPLRLVSHTASRCRRDRDAQPSIRDRPIARTSPGIRNPRDAAIQLADGRRWGRRRGSFRGRPVVVTPTRAPPVSPHSSMIRSGSFRHARRGSRSGSPHTRRQGLRGRRWLADFQRGRSSCRRGASRTSRTAADAPPPRSPSCHRPAS